MTFGGSLLARASSAPFATINGLTGSGNVLVLAPHPDDESLGCGAAIRQAVDEGHRVTVVTVTDGRHSHRNSRAWPPERLAWLRRREAEEAVGILTGAADNLVWLGFEDGGVPTAPAGVGRVAEGLSDLCVRRAVTAVWSTWRGDPHDDHRETAGLARALVARCPWLLWQSYPVWGRFECYDALDLPRRSAIRLLDGVAHARAKAAAVAAHRSQMTRLIDDDPDGFVMDRDMQAHFIDTPEIFIREN